MTYDQIIGFFKTQVAVADALGIYQSNVSDWSRAKSIPPLRQLQLEKVTSGELKAGPECDKFRLADKQAS